MPTSAEPPRIRFWRPDTPTVTGMLRLEQEARGLTTYSEHFTVVVVYEGAFDSWYRGQVRSLAAGSLKLKEPGEIHRDLRVPDKSAVEDPEGVLQLCTEKKIAYLPFFPLSVGKLSQGTPALNAIAEKHGASAAQVALAWLLARSPVILPIPGTSSVQHLEENWEARRIALSPEEVAAIGKER
ncbi:MAG: aldo/keto reductase [Deltaproteobacteria bacterium]